MLDVEKIAPRQKISIMTVEGILDRGYFMKYHRDKGKGSTLFVTIESMDKVATTMWQINSNVWCENL